PRLRAAEQSLACGFQRLPRKLSQFAGGSCRSRLRARTEHADDAARVLFSEFRRLFWDPRVHQPQESATENSSKRTGGEDRHGSRERCRTDGQSDLSALSPGPRAFVDEI